MKIRKTHTNKDTVRINEIHHVINKRKYVVTFVANRWVTKLFTVIPQSFTKCIVSYKMTRSMIIASVVLCYKPTVVDN